MTPLLPAPQAAFREGWDDAQGGHAGRVHGPGGEERGRVQRLRHGRQQGGVQGADGRAQPARRRAEQVLKLEGVPLLCSAERGAEPAEVRFATATASSFGGRQVAGLIDAQTAL